MEKCFKLLLCLFVVCFANCRCGRGDWHGRGHGKMKEVFSWKQIGYNFNGECYHNSTDFERKPNAVHFVQELDEVEKFFIQSNNVPIGFEVYKDRVFVTVPRRRHGIPSTLNYVQFGCLSPLLKPYPDVERSRQLVSVYRPRVDACNRIWMVDTGHYEVPGDRRQIQPPAIVIFDLETDEQILRHELNPSILVNNRTTAGLTSITVDVHPERCDEAFAYINDLATEGLVVFSLQTKDSWRVDHPSFRHDKAAMNFTAAGHVINWMDGVFSIALAERNRETLAFYHPLVSTQEFSVSTSALKAKGPLQAFNTEGNSGINTQSGSHDYHPPSNTMFFANVARDAITCWNINTIHGGNEVEVVARDSVRLGYISDLKVKGDEVWVLANQIPKFIYNTQRLDEYNYFIMRGSVRKLIEGTKCVLPF